MEAGFDPREVMDKNDLARLFPMVADDYLAETFPMCLEVADGEAEPISHRVCHQDAEAIEAALDLVLWQGEDGARLGGKGIGGKGRLKPKGQEALSWEALFADRYHAGCGVPVSQIGERLAPDGALKAEISNAAARHIHTLRGRLKDGAGIVTDDGAYRLGRRLCLGRIRPAVN